jgi:hypothetical protein
MVAVSKPVAKSRLGNVPEEKRFWVVDGKYLSNLEELKAALEAMSVETYLVHCNESKSDFSVWVKEVIGDDKLATDLKNSATAYGAAKSVAARIRFLKTKAGAV